VYDEDYFRRFYDPNSGFAYERSEHWLTFFGSIADRIVRDIAPRTVLDMGCAMGLLVESLRDRGVEAYGIDISDYAIDHVRDDVKPYCRLGSITEPLQRDYDLIITIETLEHLAAADAELTIDNICTHTSDVLFSSTPLHYREPTHVNVRQLDQWAETFARHHFYRDTEYDPSTYVAPWAIRLRRAADPIWRTVGGYERLVWRLSHESFELREAVNANRGEIVAIEARATAAERRARDAERDLNTVRGSRTYRLAAQLGSVARARLPPASRRRRAAMWLSTKVGRPRRDSIASGML
jgi:SAM-dependent methyltransferase